MTREVLLILTADEHRKLVELTLPLLAASFADDDTRLLEKLVYPRQIQDLGVTDGHQEKD